MAALVLLYEDAHGYALFERVETNEIAEFTPEVQQSFQDFGRFNKIVKLKSFLPFKTAEDALENANDVSEGVMNNTLKNFLDTQLVAQLSSKKDKKKGKIMLGVAEEKLGSVIQENLGITCQKNTHILELLRGIRLHFEKYITEFKEGDLIKAQRGLAHGYSRAKVKFNIHRVDNMVIQSISLLDQLDKDLNTFSMRCREWYSWHFPELVGIVNDNAKYAQLCKLIKDKSQLDESKLGEIEEIVNDRDKAQQILEASRASMGTDIAPLDMINIERFADRVIELTKYRAKLYDYLISKMHVIAPNLSALIGEQVAARLIAHAGSLTNLAKYPASTVQILGAEKALFRALKTKGNTPKYGLIFHSSFIGRASTKNKGRISRYLANKSSIASRIDAFSETSTQKFGEKLKEQVEERLRFYDTGETPKKNVDVMHEVVEELKREGMNVEMDIEKKKKKKKKSKKEETPQKEEVPTSKKDKKRKKKEEAPQEESEEEEDVEESVQKKKKKKNKEESVPAKKKKKNKEEPVPEESSAKKKKKNKEEPVPEESPAKKKKKKDKKKKKE